MLSGFLTSRCQGTLHWIVKDDSTMTAAAFTRLVSLRSSRVLFPSNSSHRRTVCSLSGSDRCARHYVNLTNGLEVLPALSTLLAPEEVRFVRLQSSHCEIGAYDKFLREVDHDLLWSLANGHTCYIYDFASRLKKTGVPRSIFLGLEFVKWSLAYVWFGADSQLVPQEVLVRGKNVVRFWREEALRDLVTKDTKKRLKYYRPFVAASGIDKIDLRGVYGRSTSIDGRKDLHVAIARKWLTDSCGQNRVAELPPKQNRIAQDNASRPDMAAWLKENRMAVFNFATDADELTEIQRWMSRPD